MIEKEVLDGSNSVALLTVDVTFELEEKISIICHYPLICYQNLHSSNMLGASISTFNRRPPSVVRKASISNTCHNFIRLGETSATLSISTLVKTGKIAPVSITTWAMNHVLHNKIIKLPIFATRFSLLRDFSRDNIVNVVGSLIEVFDPNK
jgi:hypothetical protein